MADTLQGQRKISIEEFEARYLNHKVELVDGRLTEIPMPGGKHARIATRLGYFFEQLPGDAFTELHLGIGDGVRRPDLAYYTPDRPPPPDQLIGVCTTIPALIVEVVSPNDPWKGIQSKVALYLDHGVRQVWLVDPEGRTIQVHTGPDQLRTYRQGDVLTAGELIPTLSLALSDLFAPLDALEQADQTPETPDSLAEA